MSTADSIALDNMTDFQSEILLEKSLNGKQQPDFNDFDAVLNCVSRMEAVTKLQYKDYHYMINTNSSIEVAKEIYFTLAPQTAEEGKTGIPTKVAYRLHSDSLGIKEIKDYIALCRQEYESQRNNKLGNDICFFDQVTANDNKSHQALSFDKKSFQTFRTFDNVFFEEKPEVEGRVKHFMENKQWYVKRGIPYTLGFMFHGPPGCGKCEKFGTQVLKYDGKSVAIETLKVGDRIMGDSSEPRTILSTTVGRDMMYRIKQGKGDEYTVNSVHVLSLKLSIPFIETFSEYDQRWKLKWYENFEAQQKSFTVQQVTKKKKYKANFLTKDLAYAALAAYKQVLINTVANKKGDVCDIPLNEYIAKPVDWKHAFKGYKRAAVDWWVKQPVRMDPYMMGYWLGDGTSSTSAITSQDSTVLKYFATEVPKQFNCHLNFMSKYTYRISSTEKFGGKGSNKFLNALKNYELINNKFVDDDYKFNDIETRQQLLAGFLDADGHLAEGNHFEYSQKSRKIFDDIAFVARSLGYMVSEGVPSEDQGTLYYRATIYGNGIENIPTKIPRKRARKYGHNKDPMTFAIEVEVDEEGDFAGFTLDGNGRYCHQDFTVTHNTSTIKAIANVTRRHIFNVRLSELKTNTQLKNLFFNPVVQVVNPETLCVEKFVVPIHQRFYVIEDIDCMTDLIKRRELRPETEDDEELEPVKKPVKKLVKKPVKKPAQDFLDGDEELQAYYDGALDGEKIDMTRDADSEDARDKITFSDLLNAFDGTNEVQSRMIAFTTNHLEVIDPALIRPGRVDMIIEFKNCTRAIIKQMFESFYEQTFDGAKFSKIKDYKISPASINQVLFKHFTRPDAAIEELSTAANKRKVYKKRDKDTADD